MNPLRHVGRRISELIAMRSRGDGSIELPKDEGQRLSNVATSLRLASGRVFGEFRRGPRGDTITATSHDRRELIKIELKANPRKRHDIRSEARVMSRLRELNCASCPEVLESGTLEDPVAAGLPRSECPDAGGVGYIVQRYVPPGGRLALADLVFSLLEQKALGVYQCDVKPAHVRIDPVSGACVLIDYDQALSLDPATQALDCASFLRWTDEVERAKNGVPTWREYFPSLRRIDVGRILDGQALNLALTTAYRRQQTTNNELNVYHTIHERDLHAAGTRDVEDRRHILDAIAFRQGERVLDLGCNAGLLCHYLHDRGCSVTGVDIDPFIVSAAGTIARITGRQIRFMCGDLDSLALNERFDTAILFSVLHHVANVEGTARDISAVCDRVLIEARPIEAGKKPDHGEWVKSDGWRHDDVDQLIKYFERLFNGFGLVANHGVGGKGRYILEFARRSVARAAAV